MDDTELKGRFGSIDVRFDGVDARFNEVDIRFDRVDARFNEVDIRFDKVDARFSEVDTRFDKVDARFNEVDKRFNEIDIRFDKVDGRFSEMQQLILEEGRRTRSHFDVVAEGLKDQVTVIAEGHAALIAGNAAANNRLQRLESGQERIELRMLAVESRVGGVEKTQKRSRRRT